MNNTQEYRTTLHHVKAGMQVIYHGESKTLTGNGGNKITVLEKIDDWHKSKSGYV
ncbi:MAG TPA: hypothetical protein ACHBZ9_08035 [Arsenophonus nasoniae]|uniref:hypothetical protein n=1 Tax=Arsenophonus nasoniae TaxID=638 RepID=UPI00387935B6